MNSKLKARLNGVWILVCGICFIWYNWHSGITVGYIWLLMSVSGPFFAFIGFSVILYPISKEERLAKYGSNKVPWMYVPLGQKIMVYAGLIFGVINLVFFRIIH